MSNDNESPNDAVEQQQNVSSKEYKPSSRSQAKKSQPMTVRPKDSARPKSKDDFYISPILLIGGFLVALGAGFLLPGSGNLNAPAYQTWSIIFAGAVVCIPGIIQQVQHMRQNKQNSNKKSTSKSD